MAKLISEVIRRLAGLVKFLMIIALVIIGVVVYLGYQAVMFLLANPASLLPLFAGYLAVRGLRRYVFKRRLTVPPDAARIVKTREGLREFYRGEHRLALGDSVISESYSLLPRMCEANEEEVRTAEQERVRLSAACEILISDPLAFYLSGGKVPFNLINQLNRQVLLQVIRQANGDELFNCAAQINVVALRLINRQLKPRGVQLVNYYLALAIWPETNDRWLRDQSRLALQAGQYWKAARGLERARP